MSAAGASTLWASAGRVIAYLFAMWFFDEMHVNRSLWKRRSGAAASPCS